MKHTMADLVAMSYAYNHYHGVREKDVKLANYLSQLLEDTRCDNCPTPGDIIICKGPGKVEYKRGHLDRELGDYSSICVKPYTPFTFASNTGLYFSTSGGYWFSVPDELQELVKYVGKDKKLFTTWGHCGACADGAFKFQAIVNVWEIFMEDIY